MSNKLKALLEGFRQGGSLGLADEVDGVVGGVQEAAQDSNGLMDFFNRAGPAMQKNAYASRHQGEKLRAEHPVIAGVGDGIGTAATLPMTALGGAGRGATALWGAMEGVGRGNAGADFDDAAFGAFSALGGSAAGEGLVKGGQAVAGKLKGIYDDLAKPRLETPEIRYEQPQAYAGEPQADKVARFDSFHDDAFETLSKDPVDWTRERYPEHLKKWESGEMPPGSVKPARGDEYDLDAIWEKILKRYPKGSNSVSTETNLVEPISDGQLLGPPSRGGAPPKTEKHTVAARPARKKPTE